MFDMKSGSVSAEDVLKKIFDRLWFTATYGDAAWAASVSRYIQECIDDVEASGEQTS